MLTSSKRLFVTPMYRARTFAVLERSVQTVAGSIVMFGLAWYLPGDEFGELAAVASFVMICGQLAATGLRGTIVVAVKTWEMDAAAIVWSALAIRLVVSIVVLIGAITILMPRVLPDTSLVVAGLLGLGLVLRSAEVAEYAMQGVSRFRGLFQWRLVGLAILFIAAGTLTFVDLPGTVYGAALRCLLLAAAPCTVLLRNFGRPKFASQEFWRTFELAKKSWPLMISGTGALVYLRADQVFLPGTSH